MTCALSCFIGECSVLMLTTTNNGDYLRWCCVNLLWEPFHHIYVYEIISLCTLNLKLTQRYILLISIKTGKNINNLKISWNLCISRGEWNSISFITIWPDGAGFSKPPAWTAFCFFFGAQWSLCSSQPHPLPVHAEGGYAKEYIGVPYLSWDSATGQPPSFVE